MFLPPLNTTPFRAPNEELPRREFSGRLGAFLDRLDATPDPRLYAWTDSSGTGDPKLALLAGCIAQDLTIAATARLLRELRERLGPALLSPWTLRQDILASSCQLPWLSQWPHRDSLPGWITATGDLLREHPDPSLWSRQWPAPRDFVRTLALRIPWMGRKSADRVKGWRLARWLVRGEGLQAPLWPGEARASLRLPSPVLSTPLGWFHLLPPAWDSRTPRERQEWTDAIVSELRPDDPASAWPPLETILRRGRTDSRCAELLGGCERCPLHSDCKEH